VIASVASNAGHYLKNALTVTSDGPLNQLIIKGNFAFITILTEEPQKVLRAVFGI